MLGYVSRSQDIDKEVVEIAGKFGVGHFADARTAGSLVPLLSSLAYPVSRQSSHPWSVPLRAMVLTAVVGIGWLDEV